MLELWGMQSTPFYNLVAMMVDCINYLIIWFGRAESFSVTC